MFDLDRIEAACSRQRLSRAGLAQASGLDPEQLDRLLSGKALARAKTLQKLAQALELEVEDLLLPPPPQFRVITSWQR